MNIDLSNNKQELGQKAARLGAARIRQAIAERGAAHIILATGASQFEVLESLIKEPDISWQKVTVFHLDEYIGMPETHNASFRRFLKTRFVEKVDGPGSCIFIEGDAGDTDAEIARVSGIIANCDIDVAFIGIGENGHLAFNDPPADFETTAPYIVVDLDQKCRLQQLNEGWFPDISDVPTRAISMTIRQILKSETLICAAPETRKAEAVKGAVDGPVTNLCPASILQTHAGTYMFLDHDSAALLDQEKLASAASGKRL